MSRINKLPLATYNEMVESRKWLSVPIKSTYANPVFWVARLPRIRCLRSWDCCLITQRIKTVDDIFYVVVVVAKAEGGANLLMQMSSFTSYL